MFAARARRAGDIHQELEGAKAQKTDFTGRERRAMA
jgi:hypothetical protein